VVRTGYRMDWGGVRAEVDRSDLEGVEDIQKPAYVVGAGVADYIHFYCCQAPGKVSEVFNLLRDLQVKKRADERTRTADLISLRVCGQWLLGVAHACKSRINRRSLVLSVARYCRALRLG
jgi:hypothetical protein